MGRLKAIRPRLTPPTPRLGYAQGDTAAQDRSRNAFAPWRAWYHTARWTKLRQAILLRDCYTCRMCGRIAPSRDLVADHITPHRGDPALFWDDANLQVLCHHPCHSSAKQRSERA